MEQHIYEVGLEWQSHRKGLMSSPDLEKTIEVATPPQFPGGMEAIWSPEHLFTSAVLSCFMTTFLAIAENSKLPFKSFSCKAYGKLEKVEGKYLMSAVELKPVLVLEDETLAEKAKRILAKAEEHCLITNSVKSAVTMDATVLAGEEVSA